MILKVFRGSVHTVDGRSRLGLGKVVEYLIRIFYQTDQTNTGINSLLYFSMSLLLQHHIHKLNGKFTHSYFMSHTIQLTTGLCELHARWQAFTQYACDSPMAYTK